MHILFLPILYIYKYLSNLNDNIVPILLYSWSFLITPSAVPYPAVANDPVLQCVKIISLLLEMLFNDWQPNSESNLFFLISSSSNPVHHSIILKKIES